MKSQKDSIMSGQHINTTITIIIGQVTKMKKDLYRFAKARRYGERIQLAEGEWYTKYNNAIYKLNTTTNR